LANEESIIVFFGGKPVLATLLQLVAHMDSSEECHSLFLPYPWLSTNWLLKDLILLRF